ncbi:MAG: imidazole glycerol phosphate synthase subunit HisH [Candidatus Goldbacteria bacterium]|nr:imidazole glycerol phosphate synthase subunit HisH [Candidatus Goldiibacteriota bacterium]
MKKYLSVINYGMGNLHSVIKSLQYLNIPAKITDKNKEIKNSIGIILPGVGAFKDAMKELRIRKLINLIKEEVIVGKPILGICLGMQLLFTESYEFGRFQGLNFIKGKVIKFKTDLKVPHIGWNSVTFNKKSLLLKGIKNNSYFYFVHSYYCVPEDKKVILTKTKYGNIIFASGVEYKNIYGFQFHPEKSSENALKIYKNFFEICKK